MVDNVSYQTTTYDSSHHINLNCEKKKTRQHLCLDKAYNSEHEEQELIKRGYVLHIPYKKKKGDEDDGSKDKSDILTVKNILLKDGL